MKCLKCWNSETKVIDSRTVENWYWIRRRRECEVCCFRFTTYEKLWITDITVVKKDWSKEMYDRIKVKKSLMLAFAKRDIKLTTIENILNNLEIQLLSQSKSIESKEVWKKILDLLKDIDVVAYIRFASVYMNFDWIWDFKKIIEED